MPNGFILISSAAPSPLRAHDRGSIHSTVTAGVHPMLRWIKLHPCQVIALGVAFACVAFVAEREVSRQAIDWPLGWVAVVIASAVSFACGTSTERARRVPPPPEALAHDL